MPDVTNEPPTGQPLPPPQPITPAFLPVAPFEAYIELTLKVAPDKMEAGAEGI